MQAPVEESGQVDAEVALDGEQELTPCTGKMKRIGTAVIPNEFERSLAMIVGSSGKNALHQGSAEVDGSRIRAPRRHLSPRRNPGRRPRLAQTETQA
jgi:hypothetical protein